MRDFRTRPHLLRNEISRDENFSILPLNWENGLRPGGSNRPTGL